MWRRRALLLLTALSGCTALSTKETFCYGMFGKVTRRPTGGDVETDLLQQGVSAHCLSADLLPIDPPEGDHYYYLIGNRAAPKQANVVLFPRLIDFDDTLIKQKAKEMFKSEEAFRK